MNKKSLRFFPWLVVLMGSFGVLVGYSTETGASTSYERETLRDIPAIVLNPINFTSTPTGLDKALPLEELRKEVEMEMRKAGVPLLPNDSMSSLDEFPHLQIQGAVSQITTNYYAYTILIQLHQEATLGKKAGQRSLVVTWSEGTLSTGDIQKFQDRVMLLARLFIDDYLSVNPQTAQAWPLRWN